MFFSTTNRKSHKPIIDKLYQATTSHSDKLTRLDQYPDPPRRRRKPQTPWVMPWILQREERGCYRTLLADLIHTDIPDYQNFLPAAVFALIEECIHQMSATASVTNFRKPLELGLKLALMLRQLTTEKTCTSLQYH